MALTIGDVIEHTQNDKWSETYRRRFGASDSAVEFTSNENMAAHQGRAAGREDRELSHSERHYPGDAAPSAADVRLLHGHSTRRSRDRRNHRTAQRTFQLAG